MLAVTVAAAALSAYQAQQQGDFQKASLQHQAKIADHNRIIGENNAIASEQAAQFEADMFDDALKRHLATGRTRVAKSGVVLNQDTPLLVQTEDVEQGMLERMAILYRGDVAAYANRSDAQAEVFRADSLRAGAAAAGTATRINVATSFARSALQARDRGLI